MTVEAPPSALPGASSAVSEVKLSRPRGREFAKSARTRARILEATVACLVEVGFVRTSTNLVAERAGLARSAMQYHFPTRVDLIVAVVQYVHDARNEMYRLAVASLPPAVDRMDMAIDIYWRQLQGPLFIAYSEIHFASRTDAELAAILRPIAVQYELDRQRVHTELFPEFSRLNQDPEVVDLTRDFTRFLVEGMALSMMTYDFNARADRVLEFLKQTRRDFRRAAKASRPVKSSDRHRP